MTTPKNEIGAIRLDARDDLAVVNGDVRLGQTVVVVSVGVADSALRLTATADIPRNHKIALTDAVAGDPLVRGGITIGEATVNVARGNWVHTHNLASRRAKSSGGNQ